LAFLKKQDKMKKDYIAYSERLDYLQELIKKGWVKTPKQICEKFNCCDKTARSMISRLREKGVCIEYCKVLKIYYHKIK
jgi:Mn-dependent DtxR family transcriptional regulator